MTVAPKTPISPLVAVLAGGLTAALLDITYAFVAFGLRGVSPARILQSIASGVLGKAAYRAGAGSALLGALLHVAIALVMAAVYVAASRRLPALNRRPWLWGPLYGIGCYLVMARCWHTADIALISSERFLVTMIGSPMMVVVK